MSKTSAWLLILMINVVYTIPGFYSFIYPQLPTEYPLIVGLIGIVWVYSGLKLSHAIWVDGKFGLR